MRQNTHTHACRGTAAVSFVLVWFVSYFYALKLVGIRMRIAGLVVDSRRNYGNVLDPVPNTHTHARSRRISSICLRCIINNIHSDKCQSNNIEIIQLTSMLSISNRLVLTSCVCVVAKYKLVLVYYLMYVSCECTRLIN